MLEHCPICLFFAIQLDIIAILIACGTVEPVVHCVHDFLTTVSHCPLVIGTDAKPGKGCAHKSICLFISDEEITVQSLCCMNEETLKSVVPKAGPRSLMLAKIKLVCM